MGRGALKGRAIARMMRIAALAACASLLLASLAAAQITTGQTGTGQSSNGQTGNGQAGNGQSGNGKNGNGWRLVGAGAGSGTIDIALVQAYQNNPQLNSQRAATRAIDENVPTAL